MNIFLIVPTIATLALIAKPVLDFLETKLVYGDDGYGLARRKVVESEMALGATYTDAQETLLMREMLARVRREASDAVQSDPTLWHQHIAGAKERATAAIAVTKPHLAKRFSESVDTLTYGDVLYPAEARQIDRMWMGKGNYHPSDDQRAAVRIVR